MPKEEEYTVYTQSKRESRIIKKSQTHTLTQTEWLEGVTCCIVRPNGTVLLEKREKHLEDAGMLDFCSGHVNRGETPLQAMIRELQEELHLPLAQAEQVEEIAEIATQTQGKQQHFFATVYFLWLTEEITSYQTEEIENILWKPLAEVKTLLQKQQMRLQYNAAWESVWKTIENKCYQKGIPMP